ncbi:ABC transporter ATP-binding protein/permease [Spiroplasma poulsonii]|uniref:Sulfate/thiosulfate import ATP-binding protein CysA n=1 Tax=Spiroplasma poulsonii TaxID=2138 RepID=A0A2P6FC89_9MOLU|nr:ABC transporter ATP-binding protein/permease [Spiroplasma poulsonii]KAF0851452.1 Sulfate/thiosulfate import ATP-binding protein CysA [Spiroplasma poulsonii]PQM31046.1 Sulfate/thiosulfate import ATP-binding protein CysA [Spiroplasma poulsonii]PWF96045.1 Sulfate/thiosulfate import ATP-binding protein CysA [Spiroplasma poulsonii]PWF98819.1 Sulfate/thiosulfate import ATP-binding protein CysA [Spiroplasma poulsonii]
MKQTVVKERKAIDASKPLVEVIDITKKYKNKVALNKVNLVINPGDRIGVIGANGSGKSTLSEIIGGIRQATAGKVVRQENLTIGLQFQESKYPIGISVMDMIKYYLNTFNIPMTDSQLRELLRTYQLIGMENKFVEGLSGGQQQRLNILLSVIHDPDLVILDEISTGLDIEVRSEIFYFLRENIVEKGKAMFLVTHMISEVEEFCEKYIYVHNCEIKEAGMVKDIVKKYGSVHNFTWQMFEQNKKTDLDQQFQKMVKQSKESTRVNKVDKWICDGRVRGKNKPLIDLMLKYYYKGFFVPFFLIVYPILLLFLKGFAFKQLNDNPAQNIHTLVGSIAMVQAMSVGIFIIPQTILEFKNSVLMKRIGATNIKPVFFVLSVMFVGLIFIITSFLWTLLWAGIFFGPSFGWKEIAAPNNFEPAVPFVVLVFISTISLGMMLSSIFKSTTSFIAGSNVIFMQIAFLSGAFIPAELINGSDVLKYVTYINPFKYKMDPFLKTWSGQDFVFTPTYGIYLGVSLGLIGVYIGVAGWKLRWQA